MEGKYGKVNMEGKYGKYGKVNMEGKILKWIRDLPKALNLQHLIHVVLVYEWLK